MHQQPPTRPPSYSIVYLVTKTLKYCSVCRFKKHALSPFGLLQARESCTSDQGHGVRLGRVAAGLDWFAGAPGGERFVCVLAPHH